MGGVWGHAPSGIFFDLRRWYESLLKIGHGWRNTTYVVCLIVGNVQWLAMRMLNFHNLVSKVWIVDQSMPNHSRYYNYSRCLVMRL